MHQLWTDEFAELLHDFAIHFLALCDQLVYVIYVCLHGSASTKGRRSCH